MEEPEPGMRYIDGKLWRLIQNFQELGNFDNSKEAQRELAERIGNLEVETLLKTPVQQEKDEPLLKV